MGAVTGLMILIITAVLRTDWGSVAPSIRWRPIKMPLYSTFHRMFFQLSSDERDRRLAVLQKGRDTKRRFWSKEDRAMPKAELDSVV
jgi:hypothetical protein